MKQSIVIYIIHDQLALLDTGAEINVIEADTLAKITSYTRNYRKRMSVATSAGKGLLPLYLNTISILVLLHEKIAWTQ